MSALVAEPLSRVRPDHLRWLWEPYLPRGKLAVLDGDPGVGKSLLTLDLAARLSRGGTLPGGTTAERPHTVLFLSAEDAAADTTRPRAEAAGADLDRLSVVTAPGGAPLRFPAHLPQLGELVAATRADLVVIDPVMAFLPPEVASGLDQCVRQVLTPLAALAERTDCAVLLVRHLSKKASSWAVRRGQGSMGIVAACRTGLLAARHPADPFLGVLAVTKSNVAGAVPSLGYRIAGTPSGQPVVEWVEEIDLSANALGQSPTAPLRTRDRATAWLQTLLANGPRTATEVYAAAGGAGIPERTLNRAKAELRVQSHKVQHADRAEWYWYDPCAAWPADAPFRRPSRRELPPLEALW